MNRSRRARDEQEHGEAGLVTAAAILISLASFLWFYSRGDILLYGDAVAHLNIARRIFDARDPGWDMLGSVWLPLPHLLIAPFVFFDGLWRTGIGGSIPSMVAYVLAVGGLFRMVRAQSFHGRGLSGHGHLRAQSVAALHAIHGNDGDDLSGRRHLGSRIL